MDSFLPDENAGLPQATKLPFDRHVQEHGSHNGWLPNKEGSVEEIHGFVAILNGVKIDTIGIRGRFRDMAFHKTEQKRGKK
jgi:hypothetical protein